MKNKPLLIADYYAISDKITIRVPTVGEILEFDEFKYYSAMYQLYATPYECMGQLDAVGIDYENITEFQLFCFGFWGLDEEKSNMLFKDIRPKDFKAQVNEFGRGILYNENNDTVIDEHLQDEISSMFRRIHCIEKNTKRAGNSAAKKFLLDRARKKLKRAQESRPEPFLENMVLKMANTQEFHYGIQECMNLNIYAFNASVKQIQKRIEYGQIMAGIYAGTLDSKKMNMEKIHWLSD